MTAMTIIIAITILLTMAIITIAIKIIHITIVVICERSTDCLMDALKERKLQERQLQRYWTG